jgi:hypothetical protein
LRSLRDNPEAEAKPATTLGAAREAKPARPQLKSAREACATTPKRNAKHARQTWSGARTEKKLRSEATMPFSAQAHTGGLCRCVRESFRSVRDHGIRRIVGI